LDLGFFAFAFFGFGAGIFAKRPLGRGERNSLRMTRAEFRKRTECATLLARARYSDDREAAPQRREACEQRQNAEKPKFETLIRK
jgi:hypothetical protein